MIVKVCGMREPDNIRAVETSGTDWMGFIFHPDSPRNVDTVPDYLPQRCKRVGVFVNADADTILMKTGQFHLDFIQLHGSESPEFIRMIRQQLPDNVGIIKMVPIATPSDFSATLLYSPIVDFFLFETKFLMIGDYYGGSGRQFDWNILSDYNGEKPFMLTGGIGPSDAERVLSIRHPLFLGVDLNSRFELSPAVKDVSAITRFISLLNKQP